MKYKIIDSCSHENIAITILKNEFLNNLNSPISILGWWSNDFANIYKALFDINSISKHEKKNIIKKSKIKKINKSYKNIELINAYEFLKFTNENELSYSTKLNFKNVINNDINFISFDVNENNKIDDELIECPHNFDENIKNIINNSHSIAIITLDKYGYIPFIESFIDNIGCNISTIDFEGNVEDNEKINFEQTINIGTKFLSKCKSIYVIINSIIAEEILSNNKNTIVSRMLKNHDNVIYIVKK